MSHTLKRNAGHGLAKKGRSCGSCQLCCIELEIESKPGYSTRLDTGEDIAKPAREECRYLGEKGCTIYDVRPLVCREFACDWLVGQKGFGPDDTPEALGFIGVRGVNWHFSKSG